MKRSVIQRSKYQLFPPLSLDRHEALRHSIAHRGVDEPTTWDDQNNLLHGWEREAACVELGVSCPREVRHFDSEAEKFQFILVVNAHRRPCLSSKEKREVSYAAGCECTEEYGSIRPLTKGEGELLMKQVRQAYQDL
jgi:hypothetical protein